jgi:predicted secreted hydrolase
MNGIKEFIKNFLRFVPNLIYEISTEGKSSIRLSSVKFSNLDHFLHGTSNVEWWYFTGVLQSPLRKQLIGFEVTFFITRTIFESRILHASLTDVEKGTFYNKELVLPFDPLSLFRKSKKMIISALGNRVEFDAISNSFRIKTDQQGLKIELDLKIQDLMKQGKSGIIAMKNEPYDSSHYFSFPNLKTIGNITFKGETLPVSGSTWHDHQWGNFHIKNLQWDWFSLRFDEDDLYIMIFNFRRKVGQTTTGNLYKNSKNIQLKNIRITSKETFKTKDGVEYPLNWGIEIFGSKNSNLLMKFNVLPLIKDQHISSFITHSYWEGICHVKGKITENYAQEGKVLFKKKSLNGTAYVELTGYE